MTTRRSSSTTALLRAIKSAFLLFLLLIAGQLILPAARAGGGVPDWVRAAAAEKLPTYPADTKAVQLLDDSQIVVKENGEVDEHYRSVFRILRPEGIKEFGEFGVAYSSDSKILLFKGWTITPSGQEIESKDSDVMERDLTTYEIYQDFREKYIRFPSAAVGSVVAYEYVQKARPYMYNNDWYFQTIIPNHRSRLSLQLPPGWEYSTLFANMPDLKPENSGNGQYVWEVLDSPAVEIEPHMPPANTIAAHMLVKYFATDPALRAKSAGSWQDIGTWAWSLEEPMKVSTPAVDAKVKELTAGKKDKLAQIQALADYVQHEIRYAAIEVGIGGWQPHAAGDVLTHQYGDCKDKATLLSTMLSDIGVESYNVTINTQRGVTDPKFPANDFNHVIAAFRLPDDVSDTTLYAVVSDPKLGRLLLFDPTNPYVSFGYLPTYEQDSYGLVFGPEGAALIHTPTLPPATNRLLRMAQFTVGPTGNLIGEFHELRWGWPAEDERAEFMESKVSDRPKIMENFLGHSLDNFTLTNARIGNLDQYDQNLTLDYQVVVNNYAKTAGDLLILRPRVLGEKGSSILAGKDRKYPIEFQGATRQDDIFDFTLPDGYAVDELPDPVKAECPYGKYQSHVEVKGKTLEYSRTYEIDDIVVPTSKLPEVRDFFREIAADERSSIVLKKIAQ
jgi:transglutaminase-like putative cysteine protease